MVVARFVESDPHHNKVIHYWENLESGQYRFHIPLLTIVEAAGAIYRRSSLTDASAAIYRLRQLTERGDIVQYPLDEPRTQRAVLMAWQYNLRGADAVHVALADELHFELITTDRDFRNYPKVIDLS